MHVNIVKPVLPDLDDVAAQFRECLKTGLVTNNSKYVGLFEAALHRYLRSKNIPKVFCNGEMALYSLIQAWKHKLGYGHCDTFDVLVPSFTFSGTVNAIIQNNLNPVFCDIDETLTIDVKKLAAEGINDSVRMIVAVGVYGNLPDMAELGRLARSRDLVLVFDSAPAFGSTYRGRPICSWGFDEVYSFHAAKVFTTMEGGSAVSGHTDVNEYLARLRDFGQYEKVFGDVDIPGLNSKMQEISAIIGLANLRNFDELLTQRRKVIAQYKSFFENLERDSLLRTMRVSDEVVCVYLYFPLILKEEAGRYIEFMASRNIVVRRYYTAVHKLKYYAGRFRSYNLDFTNSIRDRICSLPLHSLMKNEEVAHVLDSTSTYFDIR